MSCAWCSSLGRRIALIAVAGLAAVAGFAGFGAVDGGESEPDGRSRFAMPTGGVGSRRPTGGTYGAGSGGAMSASSRSGPRGGGATAE